MPGASITDFARNGLDSSNAFCGPFPCSVLGKQQAAFGGINPAVGSNIMYFPSGRSLYQGVHLGYKTSIANPNQAGAAARHRESPTPGRVIAPTSPSPTAAAAIIRLLNVAEDYNRPHRGHFGTSGLDRTHQLTFTPVAALPHGLRLSMIAHLASPLPLSAYIPAAGWRRSCRRNLPQRPHRRWHRR